MLFSQKRLHVHLFSELRDLMKYSMGDEKLSGIIPPMDVNVLGHQAHGYTVTTPVYEGPLDLLLQLIERAELDITRLALAQVTDQYLAYIHAAVTLPAEEVSAFLVIASRLLQIKSEALLPRPPIREEGEEDPGEALARQLIEYRRFKRIADLLGVRQAANLHTHLRLAPPPRVEAILDMSGLGIMDLVEAARLIFSRADLRPQLGTVVTPSPVTIRQKIGLIFKTLNQKGRASFYSLLHGVRTRLEVVVTFLALLELIKRQRVQVQQEKNFGEIVLAPAQDWDSDENFELEFEE